MNYRFGRILLFSRYVTRCPVSRTLLVLIFMILCSIIWKERIIMSMSSFATNEAESCDDECTRLRNLLKDWPDKKPKAFIHYLIQVARLSKLLKSLKSLDDNFNDKYHYPVVLFHENLSANDMDRIRSSTKSDVYFQRIRFEIPDFLPSNIVKVKDGYSIGYKHMSRFQSKIIYEQPIIRGFEYEWRLDDDSFILQPIKFDILDYMQRRGLQYGYVLITNEDLRYIVNLWESSSNYIAVNSITPTFFNTWNRKLIFYNNFEVSRLSLWLSEDYQKFIDYIDRLGGIYHNRWGDAPIKTIAVSIFVPQNETHLFKDIAYKHKFYSTK